MKQKMILIKKELKQIKFIKMNPHLHKLNFKNKITHVLLNNNIKDEH